MGLLSRLLGQRPRTQTSAEDADVLVRLGYDRETAGDARGAEDAYRRAIEIDAEHSLAHYFLARLADFDRRIGESVALFRRAAELCPQEALYQLALGSALLSARQHAEALEVLDEALRLLPDCAAGRINRCAALIELNRRPEALVELERLRDILPDTRQVHFNLGSIYREYARTEESIEEYRKTRDLSPDFAPSHSNLLLILNYSSKHGAAEIFDEHRLFGERFASRYLPPPADMAWPRRLRIGYVSPDFRAHVVAHFLEPILVNHDKSAFEIFCYHTHPDVDDATEFFRTLPEHWLHCDELTDDELAERVRADRIDILVDLAGHTAGNRLMMFAKKPAPVQATYLGYPHTSGVPAIDYHITDAFADPAEYDRFNVERQLRLPGSYFCYRPNPDAPGVAPQPFEENGFITFGCFNNFHKISEEFLDMTAAVLEAVPDSRFVLKGRPLSVPEIAERVRSIFARAGIDPARLDLRGWEKGAGGHLALYRLLDIALDSYPYNGATTTCEALWMGVPVVSRAGDRHAARMGSSLLNAVGLGDLVARDREQFVSICKSLANDRARVNSLRASLRTTIVGSPLMDEPAFVRKLERAYLDAWHEFRARASAAPRSPESSADALLRQARAARAARDLGDAEAACSRLLDADPAHEEALQLLADIGFDIQRPGIAIDRLLKGIARAPQKAELHYQLGCVFQALGKTEDAAASFITALERDQKHAKAHNNLGCLFEATGRLEPAMAHYATAMQCDPRLAQAFYNLGNAFRQQGRRAEAIEHLEKAVAADPGQAEWLSNLGSMYYEELRLDEAVACFERALAIDPRSARALENLGAVRLLTGQVEEADERFRAARAVKENDARLAAWPHLVMLYRGAEARARVREAHVAWAERHAKPLMRMTAHPRKRRDGPLRVGYLSPDLRRHPVTTFLEPLLANHDRSAVEVTCYSTSPGMDDVSQRLKGMVAHWRDVGALNDDDLADRIRTDGIDILVDLAGHTGGGRMLVMARKPAPLQGTYLGYPATTGVDAIDFRFTDAVADPEGESDAFHVEQLLRLPGGFLCFAPPPDAPLPAAPGSRPVTFGCFNHAAKITPQMLALWARVLDAHTGSRLVLKSHGFASADARARLTQLAAAHGIAAERVEFVPFRREHAEHLQEYANVDVALDVFPYNGTTTTCEALWMGVPVVTLSGRSHAARVGESILRAAGLPELVARTPEDYVRIAVDLASDAARRSQLRSGMRATLQASPLLDGRRLALGVEAAYRSMWQRYTEGRRPHGRTG